MCKWACVAMATIQYIPIINVGSLSCTKVITNTKNDNVLKAADGFLLGGLKS